MAKEVIRQRITRIRAKSVLSGWRNKLVLDNIMKGLLDRSFKSQEIFRTSPNSSGQDIQNKTMQPKRWVEYSRSVGKKTEPIGNKSKKWLIIWARCRRRHIFQLVTKIISSTSFVWNSMRRLIR